MRVALAHRRCPHRSVIQVHGDETSRAAGKACGSRTRRARESGCADTRRHSGDRGRQEGGAYRRRRTGLGGHQGLGGRNSRSGHSGGNRRVGDHPKQSARRRTNPADDVRPTHLRPRGLLRLSPARQRPGDVRPSDARGSKRGPGGVGPCALSAIACPEVRPVCPHRQGGLADWDVEARAGVVGYCGWRRALRGGG